VRADLPLLDLSSKAGLDSVLATGIALIIIALIMMAFMLCLLLRMRGMHARRAGSKGRKKGAK
jgi:hypothetical protein